MSSASVFPLARWLEGTTQPDIPFNDNALREEALGKGAIGIEDGEPVGASDGDLYVVGDAWGGFASNDVVIYYGGTWYGFEPFEGWLKSIAGVPHAYEGSSGWAVIGGGIQSVVAGSGVTVDDTDPANPVVSATGTGSGDVVGPASSTSDRVAVFDGTTGKLLKDGGQTIADLRTPRIQYVTSASTVTPTFADDMVKVTAQAAALTLANPTGTAIPGFGMVIRIKDNGTARAITYGSQYRAIGVTLPTTTTASKTTYIAMIYNSDDTTWDVLAVGTQA